jgi:hypothetical protein
MSAYSVNQAKDAVFCPHEIRSVLTETHFLNYVAKTDLKNFSVCMNLRNFAASATLLSAGLWVGVVRLKAVVEIPKILARSWTISDPLT